MKQFMPKSEVGTTQEHLLDSLKSALGETEDFLSRAANATEEQAAELRAQAIESLRATRELIFGTQESVLKQGKKAVRVADNYMHDNPWRAATTVGVVGLLVGLLISRR